MTAPPVAWSPPERFDEYQVIKPLGRGRTGLVYVALDTLLERHVAIKFIATRDDTLARFLTEARAAARIQHPNVATLYRVGQLDARAFLVWELVRGKGLDEVSRPVPPEQMLRIAIDVVRGLAAAHRRGVLHRDLKPANIMLADAGEAKLVDFGLAALLDHATAAAQEGRLPGTPYFMSPEAWRGDSFDARSDLYAIGLVLYELLAGEGPFRHFTVKELAARLQTDMPKPLHAVAPAVPESLATVVDRCLRIDPTERFQSADDLLAALELIAPGRGKGTIPDGNPYRGLRTYEAEHRALFFGRARPLQLAIERLRTESMLVVIGDSGVGKSSLCAAGVVPIVAEGALEDGRRWLVGRAIPGRTPSRNIASTLAALLALDVTELASCIDREPHELGRLIGRKLAEDEGLLLYIDQLEELVTHETGEAANVAIAIASLASGVRGVRVLATARSDFLSRLAGLPGLADKLPPSILLLGPMAPGDIREAIVGPATLKGGHFESEELINTLVESTASGQGSLPLLQFTLAELWERRDRASGTIREAALESIGGVSGALAKHADAVLVAMSGEERSVARALLLRLVTIDDTRARRTEEELRSVSPLAGRVLEALVRGRLLVASETPEGTTYEIAHEALVRGWNTLSRWLVEETEIRAARHRLEASAAEWQRLGKRRDLLWSARQLAELDTRTAEGLAARERDFLDESRRARTLARWIRRGVLAAVVIAIASVWLVARISHRREVAAAVKLDVAAASESWASGRKENQARDEARVAAFAAWDRKEPAVGELAWTAMIESGERARAALSTTASKLESALLRDPERDDVRARYADLLVDRILLAEAMRRLDERAELVSRLALYDRDQSRQAMLARGGDLVVAVTPQHARIDVSRYDGTGGLVVAPGAATLLASGPWVITATVDGRPPVRLPIMIERGEHERVTLSIPDAIPPGFIYMPAGAGMFGSSDAEAVRAWFNAVPLHEVRTGSYFIAQHETTFGEWIEFLDALPAEERERRRPRVAGTGFRGMLELAKTSAGWEIALQPTETMLRAKWGEPIRYPARKTHVEQDWRRMPVSGISYDDAVAYAAWLGHTGRVRTPRVCTEHEWERAARGTDDRTFPNGNSLTPDDANFDATYGKQPGGFGPDQVGSHPRGNSPFGIADLSGNVWEWVTSSVQPGQVVARGGSYYFSANTARVANRELPEASYRDLTVGVRLCADAP